MNRYTVVIRLETESQVVMVNADSAKSAGLKALNMTVPKTIKTDILDDENIKGFEQIDIAMYSKYGCYVCAVFNGAHISEFSSEDEYLMVNE